MAIPYHPVNATAAGSNGSLSAAQLASGDQIATSVFSHLPQNGFTEFLVNANGVIAELLQNILPDNAFTHFLITNPLVFLIFFFIIAVGAAISLDFLADAWKLPFAMLVDIIDIVAITSPGLLDVFAAGLAFTFFYFLTKDTGNLRYYFGTAGAIKCLLPVPFLKVFPLNTIMMLVSTVADRGI